jgi:biotin-(acetyl-CoA carboxylase) ligase
VQRWKELSSTLGKRIRLVDPSGEVEGEAVDLDKTGGLMIRNDAGLVVTKIAGDVVQVR